MHLGDTILDHLAAVGPKQLGYIFKNSFVTGRPAGSRTDINQDIRGFHPVFPDRDEDIHVASGDMKVVATLSARTVIVVIVFFI